MTAFMQAWERQEQTRHQILLRQLKEELAAHRRITQTQRPIVSSASSLSSSESLTVSTPTPAPVLKPRSIEPRNLLKTVAVR